VSVHRARTKWVCRTAVLAALIASGLLTTAGRTAASPEATSCAAVPPGLVGWWPGDAQVTNFVGLPGALKFGTTVAAGLVGQAFSFDGVDDYVDVGPGFDLDQMTLEAWVKIDPATNIGDRLVISNDSAEAPVPGDRQEFNLKSSTRDLTGEDGRPGFEVFTIDGSIDRLAAPTPLTAGWHHLAGVRDIAAGRVELYVDGVLVAHPVPTAFGVVATQVHTVLGTSGPAPFYNTLNFVGLIDEPAIFNRPLSAAQIAAIHTARSAGKCVPRDLTVIAPRTHLARSSMNVDLAIVGLAWAVIPGVSASPVDRIEIEKSNDGGPFFAVVTRPGGTTALFRALQFDRTYQFRVRAIASDGETSPWATGEPFRLSAIQNTLTCNASGGPCLTYQGVWTTAPLANSFGGSVTFATTPGAIATVQFSGTEVSWVSSTGPNRGRAEVLLDSSNRPLATVVDLYSPVSHKEVPVYVVRDLPDGNHTMQIRLTGRNAASSGNRVDVDAIVQLQPSP
jgi:concanavalin A-like lectin/glucanase superfamily protein